MQPAPAARNLVVGTHARKRRTCVRAKEFQALLKARGRTHCQEVSAGVRREGSFRVRNVCHECQPDAACRMWSRGAEKGELQAVARGKTETDAASMLATCPLVNVGDEINLAFRQGGPTETAVVVKATARASAHNRGSWVYTLRLADGTRRKTRHVLLALTLRVAEAIVT